MQVLLYLKCSAWRLAVRSKGVKGLRNWAVRVTSNLQDKNVTSLRNRTLNTAMTQRIVGKFVALDLLYKRCTVKGNLQLVFIHFRLNP
jgi:hypothetical protein